MNQQQQQDLATFEAFWKAYPRRVEKRNAWLRYQIALAEGAHPETILKAAETYSRWLAMRDATTWRPEAKYPATWLQKGCWDDEYDVPPVQTEYTVRVGETMSQARARLEREGRVFTLKQG